MKKKIRWSFLFYVVFLLFMVFFFLYDGDRQLVPSLFEWYLSVVGL